MKYRADNKSLSRRIWLIAMVLSMLFVQSLQVHVHTYSHKNDIPDHVHYETAHSIFNISEIPHDDEVAQLDQAHSAFMSKISMLPILVAVLITMLLAVCSRCCIRLARHYLSYVPLLSFDGQLRPPLRAPPLQ